MKSIHPPAAAPAHAGLLSTPRSRTGRSWLRPFAALAALAGTALSAATLNVGSTRPYTTIQAAITAATPGDTIEVDPGTYIENVTVNKSVSLVSTGGRGVTTVQGISGQSKLGSIQITPGVNNVTIGGVDKGFKIIGIDNGSAGLENAAVYIQGAHDEITIIGNEIEAKGDAGLIAEYNASVTDVVIEDNIFSGTTYLGANPAGNGFGDQFTLANVPRQLVAFGGGASGTNTQRITFRNNHITGTAGGSNAGGEQGNTLVTIDASASLVEGNVFEGTTTRFASSLRVRRDTIVRGNDFKGSLTATTAHLYVQNGNSAAPIQVLENRFRAGPGVGLSFGGGNTIVVRFNNFSTGYYGIAKSGTPTATVTVEKNYAAPGELFNGVTPLYSLASLSAAPVVAPNPIVPKVLDTDNVEVSEVPVYVEGVLYTGGPLLPGVYQLSAAAGALSAEAIVNYEPDVVSVTPDTPVDFGVGDASLTGSILFDDISAGASVTVSVPLPGSADYQQPSGFSLGSPAMYFDISISSGATFSGKILICVSYNSASFPAGATPSLYHYEGGAWKDVTTSVNTSTSVICGEVTSLSPFAVGISSKPVVTTVAVTPTTIAKGTATTLALTATIDDSNTGGQDIAGAEYRIGSGTPTMMSAADGTFDEAVENVSASVAVGALDAAGVYTIEVRGTDADGNVSESSTTYYVIYDPNAGSVSGGGWIQSAPGAFKYAPSLGGKANFGFVSKYSKTKTGATQLEGNTQFNFSAGGMNFHSSSYEWLVVNQNDQNAQYKGVGKINDLGNYGFMLWASDGSKMGVADTFRIQIWDNDNAGAIIYDNEVEQAIGGGNIMIHAPTGKK